MILLDWLTGKVPVGKFRSGKWRALERAMVAEFKRCQVCGCKKKLAVHHVIPFHLAPAKELDKTNLIVLCRACHFGFGHLFNWRSFNVNVGVDAEAWKKRVEGRP